jgi:uracil-DNA glycosylase
VLRKLGIILDASELTNEPFICPMLNLVLVNERDSGILKAQDALSAVSTDLNPELKDLHNRIWGCQQCTGVEAPLLFIPNKQVKVMVVTEGPLGEFSRADIDQVDQVKRHVLSPGNIFMYPFLYTIFNGKFRPDGDIEREPSTAYWTHMRKCFIKGKKPKILTRCSERYLRREICLVKPSLIIAIGSHAAKWFKRYDQTLESQLKISLEKAFLEQKDRFYSFDDSELGVHADLIILPHPSGQNAPLWRRLEQDSRTATGNILKKLRNTVAKTLADQ